MTSDRGSRISVVNQATWFLPLPWSWPFQYSSPLLRMICLELGHVARRPAEGGEGAPHEHARQAGGLEF